MTELFLGLAFALYLAASAGMFVYGLNYYVVLFLFGRRIQETSHRQRQDENDWTARHSTSDPTNLPKITTQIPLYNEANVAERVIRAVGAFDYPAELHQIQICDDSTDETRKQVDAVAEELRESGLWVEVFRREKRQGFKAGALSEALDQAHGEYIAIFDSDFVPQPDFLHRMIPHFTAENIGLVQARWGHLNRDESLLTRAQSIGIDGHFAIEQTARSANHLFLNFNGTAGVWRRACIDDAGGWQADTLTEDLDLSYRAQLRGWHLEYVPEVVVPAELPNTYSAFKSQQFRWAKGSIQTALKLLPKVLASEATPLAKIQSIFHLCHYMAHPMMFIAAIFALPALHFLGGEISMTWLGIVAIPLMFATCGPTILYLISQRYLYPEDWSRRIVLLPALMVVGFGICVSNTRAVLEALLGVQSSFVRTPKSGSQKSKAYRAKPTAIPWLEVLAGVYCLISLVIYSVAGSFGIAPFLILYVAGFFLVGISSLREQRQIP
ncbi:MAG: glycosyltransferase [Verrucomicrobiales bacterium]